MRFIKLAVLTLAVCACTQSEGASDTAATPPTTPVMVAAPPVITVDTLIARLDSARGYYRLKTTRQLVLSDAALHAEHFRDFGHDAIARLIECMSDTTSTSTYHADYPDFRYPRGMLCYEVVRALVDVDNSRHLAINVHDLWVSSDRDRVAAELKRARKAWQVVYNAKAYRMRVPS